MSDSTPTTRRDLLRYLTLGGLVVGLSRLVVQSSNLPAEACVREFKCSRCSLAEDCQIPAGVAFRQAKG